MHHASCSSENATGLTLWHVTRARWCDCIKCVAMLVILRTVVHHRSKPTLTSASLSCTGSRSPACYLLYTCGVDKASDPMVAGHTRKSIMREVVKKTSKYPSKVHMLSWYRSLWLSVQPYESLSIGLRAHSSLITSDRLLVNGGKAQIECGHASFNITISCCTAWAVVIKKCWQSNHSLPDRWWPSLQQFKLNTV